MTTLPAISTADRYAVRDNLVNVETLTRGMLALPKALAQMGYSGLRPGGQGQAIAAIMGCQDLLVEMNTAGGKSACFIIPTLALNWRTIVFSPLIALMQDQVKGLLQKGVAAGAINGAKTPAENEYTIKQWMTGQLQMLYVAPERLRNEAFLLALNTIKPDQVAVDECHCLSNWSDTFRPDYCKIGDYITMARPAVVTAFTATCPPEVEEDVRRVLCMSKARKLSHYMKRENLKFTSEEYRDINQVVDWINKVNGPFIVYCSTVARLEETAAQLQRALHGKSVVIYHGQMDAKKKEANMQQFMTGKVDGVVATNAFGMGVDKADVRLVIHRDIPGNVEALAQELGRGGRDGKESWGVTLFARDSLRTQHNFLDNGHPSRSDIEHFYYAVKSMADANKGICVASADMLEKASGVSKFCHRAVRSVLFGANVLATSPVEQRLCTIKFLGNSEDAVFNRYRSAILSLGVSTRDGGFECDLENLSTDLLVTEPTVVKNLKNYEEKGLLKYTPPPRTTPLRVIGDISAVDFKRLAQRRLQAEHKLQQVLQYQSIPDSEKHDFISQCFGHE